MQIPLKSLVENCLIWLIAFSQSQFQPQTKSQNLHVKWNIYIVFLNHLFYVRSKDKYQFSISPPRCAWKFSWVMSELFDFPEIVEYKLKNPFLWIYEPELSLTDFFTFESPIVPWCWHWTVANECLKLRKKKKTYKWHILMSFSFMTSLYVTQSLNLLQ